MTNFEGYEHISRTVDTTNTRIRKIMNGELYPIVTSSEKQNDKIGGFYPSDQIVIAGRTGTGKTSYVIQLMLDFLSEEINPRWKDKLIILYDSWEMPGWRNVLRMYSHYNKQTVKELIDYKNRLAQEQYERVAAIGNILKDKPLYFSKVYDNVSQWEERKKKIQALNTGKYIINIVDHTRLITRSNETSEMELISNLMNTGMKLKNNFNMINVFLSQMNRNIETGVTDRDKIGDRIPISSDIFGSDAVFQTADVVLALHRPGLYKAKMFQNKYPTGLTDDPNSTDNLMVECVLKQRDGWTGNILRKHDLANNTIEDMEEITTPKKSFTTNINDDF